MENPIYPYHLLLPYVRIASLMMHAKISEDPTKAMSVSYTIDDCVKPSGSDICSFLCLIFKIHDIDVHDAPTIIGCMLQLWYRLLQSKMLSYTNWRMVLSNLFTIVNKLIDDEWYTEGNAYTCNRLQFNLTTFNASEYEILRVLDFDLNMSALRLYEFVKLVGTIHSEVQAYVDANVSTDIDERKRSKLF